MNMVHAYCSRLWLITMVNDYGERLWYYGGTTTKVSVILVTIQSIRRGDDNDAEYLPLKIVGRCW